MNRAAAKNNGLPSAAVPIALPAGFEVTWAGPLPIGRVFGIGSEAGVFGFGSEEGKLLITDENGKILDGPTTVSSSGEAINGVAICELWLAATTREEVSFLALTGKGGRRDAYAFPHGAHGVSASPSGYFIAAMGRTGIMAAAPPFALEDAITVHGDDKDGFYCYRAACLRAENNAEVLVAALRLGGLGFAEFSGAAIAHVMKTVSLEGLDVVDFCPLFPGTDSLALAVLGRDGRLVLFKDLLTGRNPTTFAFQTVQGSAYRVLSCRGDVYVVTSKGIYMLTDLANAFMARTPGETIETQIQVMPMPAVDANLCGEKWLLVVTADGVYRFDVQALHESRPDDETRNMHRESRSAGIAEDWKWKDIRQSTVKLAAAAG